MNRCFVDSSAWVAYLREAETRHADALRASAQLRRAAVQMVTSNYVLDETFTVLSRRGEIHGARALQASLQESAHAHVVWVGPEEHAAAWQLFEKFADQRLSFTDATSFHLMRLLGIRKAWSYDRDFGIAGFELV